ncbi:helix-turn-helix domain-containing protein [Cohnella sp. GCM10012308]|uniref:helix-turn-helix domain-containing protein n=1 Tax=Cohnella sp. GCM10012308 TaxID=3317329 RepID=UPI003613624D
MKAFTYLEKPVNLKEVQDTVRTALSERKEAEQIQAGVDRSLPYLRQEMVRKLVTDPESMHVEPALQSRDTFLLPLKGPYTIGAAHLYWNPSDYPENPKTTQERILDEINGNLRIQELKAIAGFDSKNQLIVIVPGEYGSAYRNGRETIEELASILSGIAGKMIDLRLGIGQPAQSLLDIPKGYKYATLAAAHQYYRDDARPFFSADLREYGEIETNWGEIRKLRDQLRKGEISEAGLIIQEWTKHARSCGDLDVLRLKDSYFQFLLAAMDIAFQLGIVNQQEELERRYIWKEIDRIPNLNKLEQFVLSFLNSFKDKLEDNEYSNSSKMREIDKYILSHFHLQGFTIRSIAEHVQLSETYLCTFFKKQRGITIKEHITETRVNKAKELLRDKNARLYDVALQLGFSDANYFGTFFKRHVGYTPIEYRERVNK